MLEREVCEALAKVYPEIARHELVHGDWYYGDERLGLGDGPLLVHPDCTPIHGYLHWNRADVVWCPRPGDLLAFIEGPDFRAVGMYLQHDSGRRCWTFNAPSFAAADGPTPEDAVAAWLLSGPKRDHGTPDPTPADASAVEFLSERVHDAWMAEKRRQGFADHPMAEEKPNVCMVCDGPPSRHHTDMLPYADLSEPIKEYDRATVRTVLAALGERAALAGASPEGDD